MAAAFEPRLIQAVTTGAMTRAAWVAKVSEIVGPAAATAWATQRATIDRKVMATARSVRKAGIRVCLITNGTDRVCAELDDLRIANDFDAVFNSAEIGYAKPDLRIFLHVLRKLNVSRSAVLYFDDSARHVRSAAALGIRAHVFNSAPELDAVLNSSIAT